MSKVFLFCLGVLLLVGGHSSADEIMYARCNLKVIKGNQITWVNWQSTPDLIPVGTKLKVSRNGDKAIFVREDGGKKYEVDLGADGEAYLNKFVALRPIDIGVFPKEVQDSIDKAIAKIGMTKAQVYIAMGPPARVSSGNVATGKMSYEEIMGSDLWVYARRRFGKNIGVAFDPKTGLVSRTEGIWGKDSQ